VVCGAIQLLAIAAYSAAAQTVASVGDDWISATGSLVGFFLRAAVYGDAAVLAMCILPIIAKSVLIGRWEALEPVWRLAYIRFWLVH
jgi:hypothetical protein